MSEGREPVAQVLQSLSRRGHAACAGTGASPATQACAHTPPSEGARIAGRTTCTQPAPHLGLAFISVAVSVCLSFSACLVLSASTPFAAQILAVSCRRSQTFAIPATCEPVYPNFPGISLSFPSLSNAIWVAEASKFRSKGLEKHSGFF